MHKAAIFWIIVIASCSSTQSGHAQVPAARPATASTAEPTVYATRQKVFAIPFSVDQRVAQPIEVHLYVSEDRGASWQLYARQQPTAQKFTFRAAGDGEYWFASRTLAADQPRPNKAGLRPELRVAVDTVPPQFEFTARPGSEGTVLSSWRGSDPNLAAASLRIEYQAGMGKPWIPVSLDGQRDLSARAVTQGQFQWRAETQAPTINIRAVIQDRAGNATVVNRRLLLPSAATGGFGHGARQAGTMPPPDPFMRYGQTSEGAVPWPSDSRPDPDQFAGRQRNPAATGIDSMLSAQRAAASPGLDNQYAPLDNQYAPERRDPAHPGSLPQANAAGQLSSEQRSTPAIPVTDHRAEQPTDAETHAALPGAFDSPLNAPANGGPITGAERPTFGGSGADRAALPAGERPRMTDASRFRLDYGVESVGASGVAEVQLWATGDAGQTWQLWGVDEDRQSPFDVEVEEEGVFGFRVVIVSQNGRAGRPPQAGEPADIWVGVDITRPTAQLLSATYGQGTQAGKMILRWQADDDYLGERPVSLLYGETEDGPWKTIVSAIANSGEYVWSPDSQLPSSLYLRLEVRDEAGNVGVDQLVEPVRMDGLAPKARIHGVLPVPKIDREAFRRPLPQR